MEIRHTLEILTKDIQDIEKLVGNLHNSPEGSSIELDLALSKLRNVYEILTMIRADRWNEMVSGPPRQAGASDETVSQPVIHPEPQPAPQEEPVVQTQPDPQAEPLAEPQKEPLAEPQKEPQAELQEEPQAEVKSEAVKTKEPGILAEKFQAQSSINENLAVKRGKDMDTRLSGQPIDNIGRNIGINDRFLIIRELFNGDSDRFSAMVSNLDSADSYAIALGILEEQFSDSLDHEGVEILTGLIKRRFSKA